MMEINTSWIKNRFERIVRSVDTASTGIGGSRAKRQKVKRATTTSVTGDPESCSADLGLWEAKKVDWHARKPARAEMILTEL